MSAIGFGDYEQRKMNAPKQPCPMCRQLTNRIYGEWVRPSLEDCAQTEALLRVAEAAAVLFSSSRQESEREVWVRLYDALQSDNCPVEVESKRECSESP